MDKVQDMNNSFNHGLTITERKNLIISGVKKIESFDNEEFLMETTLGFLVIKGSELEIIKLDTYQGNVSIKGRVDSLMYLDENLKKDKDSSLLNKLFKWYFLRKFYRLFILFFYGIFFFSMLEVNYKILYNGKFIYRIMISFLFVIFISLLYFIILIKINNGILHVYFFLVFFTGYMLSFVIYSKINCKRR